MPSQFPRCQILPLPDDQVVFQIDGAERLRWHFGGRYPRPFFYPLIAPSGAGLTRMGHPGAPDHDHHRSIWFAHAKVLGIDFWSDKTQARIRQKGWLCYQDGDDEAAMAVTLGWFDGHDPKELLEQELVVGVRPGQGGETFVELQAAFKPAAESLEFGQTNFGVLAVRVAKHLSAHFGGGVLTNSDGANGEQAIFGKPARWVDYSGPSPKNTTEGITFFDHPTNANQPTHWHVREDGWMGAAVCLKKSLVVLRKQPLQLRYLLHAHNRTVAPERAEQLVKEFTATPPYAVVKANVKHQQYAIRRLAT